MSQAKALESWRPPAHAGMGIGCLTTTYGVNMDLLHKHALGGFLAVEADPEDEDEEFLFHIAFEEAAAQCEAIICYVDGARKPASPVGAGRGTGARGDLPPKVSRWCGRSIRILVGPTAHNDGYRATETRCWPFIPAHQDLFNGVLTWLNHLAQHCDSATLATKHLDGGSAHQPVVGPDCRGR